MATLNLIPMVLDRLSRGETPKIFGTDYPTPDGTCIRDYIHDLFPVLLSSRAPFCMESRFHRL